MLPINTPAQESSQSLLQRIATVSSRLLASAGVLCVIAMMIIVTLEVVSRYVFNSPSTWSDEIASYLLAAIVFLGLADNLHIDKHIRIDVLRTHLSPPVLRWLDRFAYLVGTIFSFLLVFATWTRFHNFWARQTVSDSLLMTPLWIPMTPVLLAAVAFSFSMLVGLLQRWRS